MRPQPPFVRNSLPKTDCCFQNGSGRWGDYSGDEWDFRGYNLGRQYLIESARERAKEMAVFGIILATAAWPVIYMIVTVVQVLHKAH